MNSYKWTQKDMLLKSGLIFGLVGGLAASLSFNPASQLIARNDMDSKEYQMGLAISDPAHPEADPGLAVKKDGATPGTEDAGHKPDAIKDLTFDMKIDGGTATVSIDTKAGTAFYTVKTTCSDCDAAMGVNTLPINNLGNVDSLRMAIAADAKQHQKSAVKPVAAASGRRHDDKPKYVASDDPDCVLPEEDTKHANEWKHYVTCQANYLKQLVKSCENPEDSADVTDAVAKKRKDSKKDRCSDLVTAYYEGELQDMINDGLKAKPGSFAHAAAVNLIAKLVEGKPVDKYLSADITDEFANGLRKSELNATREQYTSLMTGPRLQNSACLMQAGGQAQQVQMCNDTLQSAADAAKQVTNQMLAGLAQVEGAQVQGAFNVMGDAAALTDFNALYTVPVARAEMVLNTSRYQGDVTQTLQTLANGTNLPGTIGNPGVAGATNFTAAPRARIVPGVPSINGLTGVPGSLNGIPGGGLPGSASALPGANLGALPGATVGGRVSSTGVVFQ